MSSVRFILAYLAIFALIASAIWFLVRHWPTHIMM